jgi:hypothetical protein
MRSSCVPPTLVASLSIKLQSIHSRRPNPLRLPPAPASAIPQTPPPRLSDSPTETSAPRTPYSVRCTRTDAHDRVRELPEPAPPTSFSDPLPSAGMGAPSTGDPKSPERRCYPSRSDGEGGSAVLVASSSIESQPFRFSARHSPRRLPFRNPCLSITRLALPYSSQP